jgi:hypothetical protein
MPHTGGMRAALFGFVLVAAMPAWAQIHLLPKDHVLRNGPEEEAVQKPPPVNLRPTQLLRCPDGKGGFLMQDTPCRTAPEAKGATPAPVAEVVDLSALPPRPLVAEATPRRVEDAPSRWTKALLGGGKLALILAAVYVVYRIGRYARDRFRQRFGEPEPMRAAPRRIL